MEHNTDNTNNTDNKTNKHKRKNGSNYLTKKGVEMKQINLAVRVEIATKFDKLCDGLSRSVIFTQLINKQTANEVINESTKHSTNKTTAQRHLHYSILGD